MDMFDLLGHRARATPDRVALEDLASGERYTYARLNEQASRFAAAAIEQWSLVPGERVAYLGHNRAEFFAMLFGCAKAGLILVPLNWRLAQPELSSLLDDCTPAALIYGDEFRQTATALAAERSVLRIAIDGDDRNARRYAHDLAAAQPDTRQVAPRDPDTPWYLLYTAGTTGRPKGVIQTFRMMLANYLNIAPAVGLTGEDVLLNVLPLFHTAGINLYTTPLLLTGGTVLIARQFDPRAALAALERRATVFFGVPAVYEALLAQPDFEGARLDRVRSWGCGGAALAAPVTQRFADHGIRIRTGMGMTETGPTVFLLDEALALDKIGSVGHPQLLAEVRIVDPNLQDVAPGECGELLIRGPGVTPGYWQQPHATADAFVDGGWLRSGDIARCDTDGCYYIVDRHKDMFISGGENVYPAEIEAVLTRHPAIAETAVVGVADARWGEAGMAWLVCRPDVDTPSKDELAAFCRRELASYKIPRAFEWLDALPRNAVGKIKKQALRERS